MILYSATELYVTRSGSTLSGCWHPRLGPEANMESVLSLRDLRSSSSIVDMRYARSVLEQGYARLLNAKPDGVLDLVDCGDFWQTGSDVTLLHALLFLLEFVSTLNLPSVGSERIETKGRSVLIPIRI